MQTKLEFKSYLIKASSKRCQTFSIVLLMSKTYCTNFIISGHPMWPPQLFEQ